MATGWARRRKQAGALFASLAVHGLLLLVLTRGRAPVPAPEPPAEPLEVEVREIPVQPAPPTWSGPPAPPAPVAPPRERHASPTPPPAPSARENAPPTPLPPSPTAPTEGPSLLRMREPNLALDDATLDRFARDGVIAPSPAPAAAGADTAKPGKSKWQEKLAALQEEDFGRKNVAEGKVHPQIFDFMRDAEKVFAPRETVVEKDPRAPNTFGRTMHAWTRGFFRNYLDQLKRLETDEPRHKSALAEHGAPDLLAEYNRLLRAAEKGAEAIACQVCLIIRPGADPEVVLNHSSGSKEIDQAATDAMTRAWRSRPQELDLKPQRACYRFAATIARIPPLPIVGCGFDESTLKVGCYYPGMQVYRLKVSLDSVTYN